MKPHKLKIEQKLNITVSLPLPCYFCKEEIVKYGRESRSLLFHSLDENHDNWTLENKVSVHRCCHNTFHQSGDKGTNYGGKNSVKTWKTKRERYGPSGHKDPEKYSKLMSEATKKSWALRRERYGPTGVKDPEKDSKNKSEVGKKAWVLRREKYGPSGMRPKEEKE